MTTSILRIKISRTGIFANESGVVAGFVTSAVSRSVGVVKGRAVVSSVGMADILGIVVLEGMVGREVGESVIVGEREILGAGDAHAYPKVYVTNLPKLASSMLSSQLLSKLLLRLLWKEM